MVVLSKYRTIPSAANADNVGGRCRFVLCFMSDSVAHGAVQGSCGPEHPDSGFKLPALNNATVWQADPKDGRTRAAKGSTPNNRYTIRRPVERTCAGILSIAARNVLNSIRNNFRFSSRCDSCQRPVSGSTSAAQAFRLQANDAITMYAPSSRASHRPARVNERTSPFNCA